MFDPDYNEIRLVFRDGDAVTNYSRIRDKEEKAILAVLQSGRSLEEAKSIATEMYAEERKRALEWSNQTKRELDEYRGRLRAAAAKANEIKPWWWPW